MLQWLNAHALEEEQDALDHFTYSGACLALLPVFYQLLSIMDRGGVTFAWLRIGLAVLGGCQPSGPPFGKTTNIAMAQGRSRRLLLALAAVPLLALDLKNTAQVQANTAIDPPLSRT
jgi:hypothetical protein